MKKQSNGCRLLADVIREIRSGAGETQEEFALRSGLGRGLVGALERGARNVGLEKLRLLLLALGISWDQFGCAMQKADPLPATNDPMSACARSTFAEESSRGGPAFGHVIREARLRLGESQERLALRCGFDSRLISGAERGRRSVRYQKVRGLLLGLGMSWNGFGKAMHDVDPLPALTKSERAERAAEFNQSMFAQSR